MENYFKKLVDEITEKINNRLSSNSVFISTLLAQLVTH